MHPSQILDAHMDLATRLEGEQLRHLMATTASNAVGDEVHKDAVTGTTPRQRGEQLVYHLQRGLKIAYDYQVTEDMVDLVSAGAEALENEGEVVMDWRLAPTDAGLVRFEKPIFLSNVDDGEGGAFPLKAEWMLWGPITPDENGRKRIATFWFTDPRLDDPIARDFRNELGFDEVAEQVLSCMGRWLWVGCDIHASDMPIDYGLKAPTTEFNGVVSDSVRTGRILLSLWMMLNQTIVDVSEPPIERPTKRRAKKMGIPDRVSVIRLRRHERPYQGEGESQVEWSHRWMVRGHWRMQACGEGRKERTRIWVHPHIKGPDDKPLIVTDKLYRLER